MLSIQNNVAQSRIAFKSQNSEENNGIKPNNTHAGLKTGTAYAAIGSATTLAMGGLANTGLKFMTQNKEVAEELGSEIINKASKGIKALNKHNMIYLPIFILSALGCGALVDSAINKKRAALDEQLATQDKKDILASDDNIETTRNGELYYKSNKGKKLGTALGAVVLPALGLVSNSLHKVKLTQGLILNTVLGTLGGLTLGAITDACANKNARNHADKQAITNSQA
ncbi:hypothetical protein HDR58_06270 [bacterium]|nr:hypothetical protein [bacterium]